MSTQCSYARRRLLFQRTPIHLEPVRQTPTRSFFSTTRALVLLAMAIALPAFAVDVTDSGAPGAAGVSGVIGENGGVGQDANVSFTSSDFFNSATATAGNGGDGGASVPPLLGGTGGKGGTATANLQAGNQDYPFDMEVDGGGTVTAVGGNGGNGRAPVVGDGGAGGDATANGANGGSPLQSNTAPRFSLLVNAVGGQGGAGRNGGAGGSSASSGLFDPETNAGSVVSATAQGGAGGNAVLSGGNGGNARAQAQFRTGSLPADNFSTATAIGGKGGDSASGLNGNGGSAKANAGGDFGSRALGLTISATAVGGASGADSSTSSLSGNGGDAYATGLGIGHAGASADTHAKAQGGNGVIRGGNALATADSTAEWFGYSTSEAVGGAGKQAGAAIATSIATSGYLLTTAQATATYAGPFVRGVVVRGEVFDDFSLDGQTTATVYTQARVGNTTSILSAAPGPGSTPGLVARAATPTAQEVATILTGNPDVASVITGGSVWGIGEIRTNNTFDTEAGTVRRVFDLSDATAAYTFDISAITDPQDLWLGLLDSTLPDDSIGNFHFSVAGEGNILFEHDFSGSDFLAFFDDRTLDLGSWADLVGGDGLLNIDVSFSGYVPEIEFAFGQASAADLPDSVPEPSTFALLLAAMFASLAARRAGNRRASTKGFKKGSNPVFSDIVNTHSILRSRIFLCPMRRTSCSR